MTTFAEAFREERKKKRVLMRKIAEDTGYSIAYLSDLEHGRQTPTHLSRKVLSEYFQNKALMDSISHERTHYIEIIIKAAEGMSLQQLEDLWAKIESEVL